MKRFFFATLALCLFAAFAFAQSNTGRLVGTVSGPDGVIPGATVTVRDNQTNRERTVTTTGEGTFTVTQLETGAYTVTIAATGFKNFTANNVKIDIGKDYDFNAALEVGNVSETVTVTAGADVVNSSNAELSSTVSPTQIKELPLVARNPLDLINLNAGTSSNGAAGASINGQRPSFTNITRDGINIQDSFIRTNAASFSPERPSVDNTGEFTLTTQNAGADKGYGASQVQLVTPRGQNDFHGVLFEYNRNSAYAANPFFNNSAGVRRPFRNRNQFGGSVNGRIIKDKLFFFGFYEGVRDRRASSQSRTILTPSARAGNFTFIDNAGVTRTVNLFSIPQTVPTGATAVTGIDPTIQSRFLANIPAVGNRTDIGDQRNTTGFGFTQGQNLDRNQFTTRIDYEINDRNTINGVYTRTNENNLRPDVDAGSSAIGSNSIGGGGFASTPVTVQPAPNRFLALAYRTTPTAKFTNELRGGVYKSAPTFNRSIAAPANFISLPTVGGTAAINGLGNPEVNFEDQGRNTRFFNLQDNAEYVAGSHSLRFGGQIQRIRVNPFGPLSFSSTNSVIPTFGLGTNTNTPQFTTANFANLGGINSSQLADANALLGFLGGIVSSGSQTFNATSQGSGFVAGAPPNRTLDLDSNSLYFQDQWRVRPSLTLNLGVRYELFTPVRELRGLALEPVIPQGTDPRTALLDPNGTFNFVGGNAQRATRYFKLDKNNFAPILSFAYTPTFTNRFLNRIAPGAGKTVIRGGYRVSYVNDEYVRSADNLNNNSGLQATQTALFPGTTSGSINARLNALPNLAAPTFQVPRTFAQNNLLAARAGTITAIDPNFQVARNIEYNIGFQREIGFKTAIEIRYVGARSNNLVRALDLNQIDIFNNGFLADFNRARNNFVLSTNLRNQQIAGGTPAANAVPVSGFFNTAVPGTVQTTILGNTAGSNLLVGTGGLSAATFNNNLNAGTPADLANSFVVNGVSNGFRFNPNPNAQSVLLLNNSGRYRYNSLQLEIRRRFSNGFSFQANYTLQKTLTDAQGIGQSRIDPLLDNNNPRLDRVRAEYDQAQVFNFNNIFELPFGKGKRFLNEGGALNRIVGGFELNTILRFGTGAPLTITDVRGTLNRLGRSNRQTASTSLTKDQIKKLFSVHRTANGVLFVDPSVVDPTTGRGANGFGTSFSGQAFFNSAPGTTGNLERSFINGPSRFNMDASLIKRIPITERISFQVRAEAFNLLNNTQFFLGNTTSINSVNFGRITDTFDARVVQFAGRLEF